ncbi:MAG: mechanosensitive ion channel family protein, partial [Planctomycetota bacterium]|nr:mechanosensitive ion channel family protein [Planctomycetota bacterium]
MDLEALSDLPAWMTALIVGGVVVVGVVIVQQIVYAVLRRIGKRADQLVLRSVAKRTNKPTLVLTALLGLQIVARSMAVVLEEDLGAGVVEFIRHALSIGMIAAATWLLVRVIDVVEDLCYDRFRIDMADNLRARQIQTQVRVLTRTATFILIVLGAAAIIMTFPRARQFGASILASAGIAGLVLGLAARPAVSNLIAGVQIALTQPIVIDDVVIMEGEWGRIE